MNPTDLATISPKIADSLYRALASVSGLAAVVVLLMRRWPTPLAALDALPLPGPLSSWTTWSSDAAAWIALHTDVTVTGGMLLLVGGLIVGAGQPVIELPARSRAGASAALGLALVTQAQMLRPAVAAGFLAFLALAVIRARQGTGRDTSELVGAAALHLIGAVMWLPGTVLAAAFGDREAGRAGAP